MHDTTRGLEAIVDRQIRLWNLKREARQKTKKGDRHWPVVTISREYGALGAAVGHKVAQRFGFEFWDQEIVHAMANNTGIDEVLLETLDEHTRNNLDMLIEGILRGESYTESEYLRQLMRVVHTIGNHGGAVIIGRGAQYILEPEEALRVRAVCARELRIQGLADRGGFSKTKASKEVEQVEQDRHAFIEHHYQQDVREPSAYDLLVNTGTLSTEQTADLVVQGYNARFGGIPGGKR
jgi:cytidylate kinase